MKIKINRAYVIEILIWILLVVGILIVGVCVHYYAVVYKNTYNLHFRDIDGIIKGSPVRLMGVVVGHVRNLKFRYDDEIIAQIVITKKGVKIPKGSKATVEFTGIVGSKSIEIMSPDSQSVKIIDAEQDSPRAEGHCDGIITSDPVRIKDFLKSFDIYNKALESIGVGIDKVSTKENMILLKKFSQTDSTEPLDGVIGSLDKLDNAKGLQEATNAVTKFSSILDRLKK